MRSRDLFLEFWGTIVDAFGRNISALCDNDAGRYGEDGAVWKAKPLLTVQANVMRLDREIIFAILLIDYIGIMNGLDFGIGYYEGGGFESQHTFCGGEVDRRAAGRGSQQLEATPVPASCNFITLELVDEKVT